MSITMWVIQDDESSKIVAISEKKQELEQAILRMKVSQVLKDRNVTEAEFYDRLGKIKLSIKQKEIFDYTERPTKEWKESRNKELWIDKAPDEVYCDCLAPDKCMPHCNRFTRRLKRKDVDKPIKE